MTCKSPKRTFGCAVFPRSTPVPFPPASSSLSGEHLLNYKGPYETCNQGSNGQRQLILGSPPEPVSKTPFLSLLREPKQPRLGSLLLLLLS